MKSIKTIFVSKKTKESVEVTFPLYRKYTLDFDSGSGVYYYKVVVGENEKLVYYSVYLREDYLSKTEEAEIEIDYQYNFSENDDIDYVLGIGEHASTEAEFNSAVIKARNLLDKF